MQSSIKGYQINEAFNVLSNNKQKQLLNLGVTINDKVKESFYNNTNLEEFKHLTYDEILIKFNKMSISEQDLLLNEFNTIGSIEFLEEFRKILKENRKTGKSLTLKDLKTIEKKTGIKLTTYEDGNNNSIPMNGGNSGRNSGLSTESIIGIVIGSITGVILITTLCYYVMRKRTPKMTSKRINSINSSSPKKKKSKK